MNTPGQWECGWWRSPNFQHQAGLSGVRFGPLGRSPSSGTDNQGAGLKWERSGRGHPPLFPWLLATQFLNTVDWLATPLPLSLNRFIPTQTKSTNILAAQAMPTRGGRGPQVGWGAGSLQPWSSSRRRCSEVHPVPRSLGVSQTFPSPARQHSKAQTCGLCLPGLHPGDQCPC